jgi:hypothetical protein
LAITLTVDGTSRVGVKTALRRDAAAADIGLAQGYELSVVLPGNISVTPRRSTASIGGKTYRVLSSEHDTLASSTTLHLGIVP